MDGDEMSHLKSGGSETQITKLDKVLTNSRHPGLYFLFCEH
jgi:hypothetical protein